MYYLPSVVSCCLFGGSFKQLFQSIPDDVDRDKDLEDEIRPFLQDHGVRDDVKILIGDRVCPLALGANIFRYFSANIFLNKSELSADRERAFFCLKHEIGHIKNNDIIKNNLVFLVALISLPLLCSYAPPEATSQIVATFASTLLLLKITSLFSRYREARADDFAIQTCTDNELLGGLRQFYHTQQWNKFIDTPCKKIIYSKNGDDSFPINDHPLESRRIQKIEDELHRRGVLFDPVEMRKRSCRGFIYIE
jgi:hypothetical protein